MHRFEGGMQLGSVRGGAWLFRAHVWRSRGQAGPAGLLVRSLHAGHHNMLLEVVGNVVVLRLQSGGGDGWGGGQGQHEGDASLCMHTR